MFAKESEAYAESEAYDSASVAPIHTRSKLSSDSDSASVASVNQALVISSCFPILFNIFLPRFTYPETNIEDNTWLCGDMRFIFECSTRVSAANE